MSKVRAYIGGDPGLSGAIALYVPYLPFKSAPAVEVFDMPVAETRTGRRTINMDALARLFETWSQGWDIQRATIERVHAMPGQGVTSSFSFGFSSGSLQQAVASAKIPMVLVDPATWKAMYGLRGGRENKDESRAKASKLLPEYANLWARKKDDGRAEAVLLAHYGSKLQ